MTVVGRLKRNTTWWSLTASTFSTWRQNPASVAVASGRTMSECEWTTSLAVRGPRPKWNCTPLRRTKVHSLKSGLADHFSARRGVYSPLFGSTSSSVSRNGSYWRWSGRETTQKRLLSSNPAEANTSFWVLASCAMPGVQLVPTVNASAASTTSARDTVRRFIGLLLSHVPELGIEVITQPVAQQVQREHGQHDGETREHRDPPGGDDQLAPVGDHEPPRRQRPRQAGAEEAQGRLQEDDVAHLERGQDQQRVDDVGEEVAGHDPDVRGPGHPRPRDEVALLEAQRLAAHQARVARPQQDDEHRDDGAEARPHRGHEHQRQEDRR